LSTVHVVVDVLGWFGDGAGSGYQPLMPSRVLDTRTGRGAVPAGGDVAFAPGAGADVPADAAGVMLNLTSTESTAAGYLTAYPCGGGVPLSSNLNYADARNVANQVAIGLGADGQVCVNSFASSAVVADALGWFGPSASARFVSLAPTRVLDTRVANAVFSGRVPAGGIVTLPVLGQGGIPTSGVSAAVLNVTVDQPSGPGFVTVFPCGGGPPLASNLNYATGQVAANLTTVPVDSGGRVCLFTLAATHLVVDVSGYFTG
jgi:hypothetical protein